MEEGAEYGSAILPLISQIYMNYIRMKELRTFQQIRLNTVTNPYPANVENMVSS